MGKKNRKRLERIENTMAEVSAALADLVRRITDCESYSRSDNRRHLEVSQQLRDIKVICEEAERQGRIATESVKLVKESNSEALRLVQRHLTEISDYNAGVMKYNGDLKTKK